MLKKLSFFLFLFSFSLPLFAQEYISGQVYDKANAVAIPGASIINRSLNIGTSSNIDGSFKIQANIGDSISFSFIGMKTITRKLNQSTGNKIYLTIDNKSIDEVMVIAFGKRKKSEYTGSSAQIGKEALVNTAYASIDKLMQSQATGLVSITQSGDPSEKAAVIIRGVGSLSAEYSPLYILDGLSISEEQLQALNVNDIESVNVLKDASAIAIYGSKASNGVILINTKQAKLGKTRVSISSVFSIAKNMKDNLNMMSAEEKLRYEVLLGIKNMSEENIILRAQDNVNWKDEVFRTGYAINNSVQISSGKEKTKYLLSLSHFNKKATLQNSSFERFTSRFNFSHKLSKKIEFTLRSNIARIDNGQVTGLGYSKIQKNNPIVQAYLNNPYDLIKDKDGKYKNTTLGPNAIEDLDLIQNKEIQNKVILNMGFNTQVYNNIYLTSSFGVDYQQKILDKYNHPGVNMYKGARQGDLRGDLSRGYREYYNLSQSQILNIPLNINDHEVNATLGFETSIDRSDNFITIGKGFASGKLQTLTSASKALSTSGNKSQMASISYLSRINYSYKSNFFVDLSARRDGASMFGKDNRYANFYALGLAYNINSLIQNKNIDYLKVRYSIGTTGNSNISPYASKALFSYSETYNDKPAAMQTQLGNSSLTWEKCLSTNIGVDLSMFNNKLNVNADIYKRLTTSLLFDYELSRTTGFSDIKQNSGEMINKGIELSVKNVNIKRGDFIWTSKMNISYNINEVSKLQNHKDVHLGFTILREGVAIGTLYRVKYAGVNPATGNPMWYNKEGIPSETYNISYAQTMKPGIPPLYGGLHNSVKWKDFRFSFQISYAYGNEILNNAKYFTNSDGEFSQYNQNKNLLYKRWKNIGDITQVPRQIKGGVNNQMTSKYIEDGSYIKLKNIELSYNIPKRILSKISCSSANIYLQANNLYTLTNYTGFDPELAMTIDSFRYPPSRNFNIGLNLNF